MSALLASEYSYFIYLLDISELLDKLESDFLKKQVQVTFVVPSNENLQKNVPPHVLQFLELPSSLKQLKRVMLNHVVQSRLTSATWQQEYTLQSTFSDRNVVLWREGTALMIDNAMVTKPDVFAEQDGAIFEISSLLIPEDILESAQVLNQLPVLNELYNQQFSRTYSSFNRYSFLETAAEADVAPAPAPSPSFAPFPDFAPSSSPTSAPPPPFVHNFENDLKLNSDFYIFAGFMQVYGIFDDITAGVAAGNFYTVFAVTSEGLMAESSLLTSGAKSLIQYHVAVSDSVAYSFDGLLALGVANKKTATPTLLKTLNPNVSLYITADNGTVSVNGTAIIADNLVDPTKTAYNASAHGVRTLLTVAGTSSPPPPVSRPPPPGSPPPASAGEKAVVPATPLLLCLVTLAIFLLGTAVPLSITG
eukprot:TRINITY_DN1259_c0_g2_i2.p1 TRINITY_DN1259_c0_g2~~TRINITY_DN1259_c0_g2_i2.p1  ORF type:complete len:465 (-),score=38.75 TRINITY_DN1259_c0_g2_i2:156-1415(-)